MGTKRAFTLMTSLGGLHHTIEGRNPGILTGRPDRHVNFSTNSAAFDPELWPGGYCRPDNIRGYIRVLRLLEP